MRHLSRYIERTSMEDAENQEAVVLTPVEDVVELEETMSIEPDELIEAIPADDSIHAELEEVADIQTSLEQFDKLVTAAIARGGFRPEEGVIFQTSLEHFQKRLGMERTGLGLEDFGGTMSRMKATGIAQENLKEVAEAAKQKLQGLIGCEE